MRVFAKPAGIAALGVLALVGSGFLAFRRPLHFDSAWTDATRAAFERATGLAIAVRGPIDVSVFPRPMIVAHDVAIGRNADDVVLQAPVVRGLFSLSGLLAGRPAFDKLEFDDVAGSIDADALVQAFDTRSRAPGPPTEAGLEWPSTVAIAAGSVQVRSAHPGVSGFLSDLHLLVDGIGGGAGAISGGAVWHGERVEVSGRVDSVEGILAGKPTAGSLKVRSDVGSAAVVGTITAGHPTAFKGSVTASSPSLSTVLRMAGFPPGVMEGIGHFGFAGTAEPTPDGVAFEDAHLVINEDNLEGSVALQMQDGRLDLLGTLAAEKLDIGPFLATLPALRTARGGWNTEPIPFDAANLHDTDLRLSVGRLQFGDLHADDVALSLLCRQGRMELSLGEARTYGGLLKARLFAASAPGQLKADVSWSQVDVAALSAAAPQLLGKASGTSSGFVSLDGTGENAATIVQGLDGKGQASWRQVQARSVPALAALLEPLGGSLPTPLSFDLASLDFTVTNGLLSIGKASVSAAGARMEIGGQTDLPNGSYVLTARPEPAGDEGADAGLGPVRRIAGVWGKSVTVVGPAAAKPGSAQTGSTEGLAQ